MMNSLSTLIKNKIKKLEENLSHYNKIKVKFLIYYKLKSYQLFTWLIKRQLITVRKKNLHTDFINI
jgi:hypothetical protein